MNFSEPSVSICLPNLNQRAFIGDRMESILKQDFQNWECIAYDNYSNDGSWEIIECYAQKDSRISAKQAPKQGMYANWNNCISKARGKYVYIATSDDTMNPDCLHKMVQALETQTNCDICQCGLQMIDREGRQLNQNNGSLYWESLANADFYGDALKFSHIRMAPYDGIVALSYGTAWTSMTQVLLRRSIFDRIGLFPTNWSAVGDAAWQMKAGLIANIIYLPEKLATWRYYEGQGSGVVYQQSLEEGWMYQMGLDALAWYENISPQLALRVKNSGILNFYRKSKLYHMLKRSKSAESTAKVFLDDQIGCFLLLIDILSSKLGFKTKNRKQFVNNILETQFCDIPIVKL